ncbi:MAG: penicillin-binding protein 2 [Alphaproteobacteria bacterium]|nr:penicillin-binding protein 2 [Alphaproteobacteria bacterium]
MLKDRDLRELLSFRKNFVLILIGLLCLVLIGNLYILQVKHAKKYRLMSDRNRIRVLPMTPKRGRIISSDGKVLAFCDYRHRIVMDYCSKKVFEENVGILDKYLNFTKEEKESLFNLRKRRMPSITIKNELSRDEFAKISMNLFRLKGVHILNTFSRHYSMPLEFSHLIGYTAKNTNEFQVLTGKTGLEIFFDKKLRGNIGNIQKEVNAAGCNIRIIDQENPVNGEDIKLTIDSEIQKFVYDLLGNYKVGACCVLDMKGNVVALVSFPGYDINSMSLGISHTQWNELNTNEYKPMLNRFSSSVYPPGSVFKIVTAYAALCEGIVSPKDRISCLGGVKLDGHTFHCWHRGGHGKLNIYEALIYSCDCYFFQVAKKLGIQKLDKYARELGFGQKTDIELPNEKSGLIPNKEWKLIRRKSYWKPYETMIAGIGQGYVLTSLIQIASMMGKIYSNNLNYSPSLLPKDRIKLPIPLKKEACEVIKKALRMVCEAGTARKSCRTAYGIAGKTGSSQVRSIRANEVGVNQQLIEWKSRDHALFAGVAPAASPKYIVAVIIEHGGGGGSVAAPIARKVFDKLLEKDAK